MNKSEFINAVAEAGEYTKKDAAKAVDVVLSTITEALKNGEKIQLIGFGNFEVRQRAARNGINPQTKEPQHYPATKVPAFKPGTALKAVVK